MWAGVVADDEYSRIRDYFQDTGFSDGLPSWVWVIELATEFGALPDDVAEHMSETWYWRSVVYLTEKRNRVESAGRRPDGSDMIEYDEQGNAILRG